MGEIVGISSLVGPCMYVHQSPNTKQNWIVAARDANSCSIPALNRKKIRQQKRTMEYRERTVTAATINERTTEKERARS